MTELFARVRPYGLALLCAAGAVGSRWLLDPLLQDNLPFVTAFVIYFIALYAMQALFLRRLVTPVR